MTRGDSQALDISLFVPRGCFKRNMNRLLLAFAIITCHANTCNLQNPGSKTCLIVRSKLAYSFDHLQKYLRGKIFRGSTIRNASGNVAIYAGQELTVECAQCLRFTSPRGIKQTSKSRRAIP